MFRRRIYAQGFTLLAMLAGSVYWESDRKKRKEYDELVDEKKKKEKHEQWIKELEIREQEDELLKQERHRLLQEAARNRARSSDGTSIRSVLDPLEARRTQIARTALEALGGHWM